MLKKKKISYRTQNQTLTNYLNAKVQHIQWHKVRTLIRISQLPELTTSTAEHNIDIVCIQKRRYYHSEVEIKYHDTGSGWTFISAFAWKNSQCRHWRCRNASQSSHAKALYSTEKIQLRMIAGTSNGNPSTTIVCYSPDNASDETDRLAFYNELSPLVCCIPNHNVLIISEDINAKIGTNENKFCLHNSSNRNGEQLTEFSLENRLTRFNTKF